MPFITCDNVCNAESEAGNVSKSAVLEIIARQRAAFEFLNMAGGLSPDSPCRFTRERFEIVAGKLMALDSIAGLVHQLPPCREAPEDLTGEKSNLPPSVLRVLSIIQRRLSDSHRATLFHSKFRRADGSPCSEWSRSIAAEGAYESLIDELRETFSGNAGMQPGPGEESWPLMGTPPVTAAAANPPAPVGEGAAFDSFDDWMESQTSAELHAAVERILDEIEARGCSSRWQMSL